MLFYKLVFHDDTVDGETATVGEDGLYTVGIEVKATLVKEHYRLPPL